MNFATFAPYSPSPFDTDISAFDLFMFHGYARRRTSPAPARGYFNGDRLDHVLHLIHNVDRMPEVISPSGFLLVTKQVKDQLRDVRHINFLATTYEKLFSISRQGKVDCTKMKREEDVFSFYKHEPRLVNNAQVYYEVIPTRTVDVKDKFKTVKRTLHVPTKHPISTELSDDMLREYPVLWAGYYIVSIDIFGKLVPFLDPHFYKCGVTTR